MSTRERWNSLSLGARHRIVQALVEQASHRPRYTAEMMVRRQNVLRAFLAPDQWPLEVARMREHLGPAINRRQATRIWAVRHLHHSVDALKSYPAPMLPK